MTIDASGLRIHRDGWHMDRIVAPEAANHIQHRALPVRQMLARIGDRCRNAQYPNLQVGFIDFGNHRMQRTVIQMEHEMAVNLIKYAITAIKSGSTPGL